MKKATRKQEIELLRDIVTLPLDVQASTARMTLLKVREEQLGITCVRINEWRGGATEMPLWQWEAFLSKLELGWKRYFYACNHEDSIFCRIHYYFSVRTPCTCCLWWRTVAIAITLTIASFFLGKYLQ